MAIVQTSDFVGEWIIPSNCFTKLPPYIEKYEEFYLVRLLGADLFDLFIADLTGPTPQVPQAQRFIDIFDPFNLDDSNNLRISEGIKQMLVEFIYFHFMRDKQYIKTNTGTVRTEGSISEQLGYNGWNLVQSYNQGITNYFEIQWFIQDNSSTYPEENGIFIGFTSGI